VLQIDVWKEPEVSVPSMVVPADGVIALPLVKELQVTGLTPAELRQQLTARLSTLIRDPDVTVIVKEIRSPKVFIIGAVRKEGPILLNAPTAVLQALAEAGGLTDYAKRSKVYVLRMEGGKQTRIPVDYPRVVRGERPEDNIILRPGDTIVVP
jgi:polysaccharide export outer membrane protein